MWNLKFSAKLILLIILCQTSINDGAINVKYQGYIGLHTSQKSAFNPNRYTTEHGGNEKFEKL
jgi:hypothetical protein